MCLWLAHPHRRQNETIRQWRVTALQHLVTSRSIKRFARQRGDEFHSIESGSMDCSLALCEKSSANATTSKIGMHKERTDARWVRDWIEQRRRTLVFCRAEVRTASGKLAADGTLTYTIRPPR